MVIEGYFDGTAVRTLEPVDLKPQQKVFIHVPETDLPESKKNKNQKNWMLFILSLICFLKKKQRL